MKRIQEKIKDLVEAKPYDAVKNYQSNAEHTVAAYRFTDATSELLAKWFDEIAHLAHGSSDGAAHALAGNRGAGKSHLLSVLAAITENAELRARLSDSHVAASAQSLPRRQLKVVRVERGISHTFFEEFQRALEKTFGSLPFAGETAAQMLAAAAQTPDAEPLVVIVDSAQTRAQRVKRDDGEVLSEMAEVAKKFKVFLTVALDDDISGADGVNSVIARSFRINFLDQEHLYRILDTHIFPKKTGARSVLRELYQMMRVSMPGFNWSEPRFAALYPIHPVVADVIPAVRLYAQHFAFLPFASESGRMTLNRPAHSLIALDEIFDRAEPDLRKSEELKDALADYDRLAAEAMGKIPVMQRLQAKLVLKGLFVLSLDGRGASAREIAAAMLIYDEGSPETGVRRVEEMLQVFSQANENLRAREEGGEKLYCLGAGAAVNFETALGELAARVAPEEIRKVLRRAGETRFSDWVFGGEAARLQAEFSLRWRGTQRRGRVSWETAETTAETAENLDWEVLVAFESEPKFNSATDAPQIVWQPAALRSEEEQTLRRYAALHAGVGAREELGEAAHVAAQSYAALVERIWTRIFIDEGSFWLAGETVGFAPETKAATTLEKFLEAAVAPVFDRKFAAHPHFRELLTGAEVSTLVSEFFGTGNINSPQVQKLAENFAVPLGLASDDANAPALESDEKLLQNPLAARVWNAVEQAGGRIVPLAEIYAALKAAPYGLSRDAQHLVLAALVARRRIEFVTKTGERVGRRFLNLKIIWTEITGIERSATLPHGSQELIGWARQLTGEEFEAASLADAENVRQALKNWLEWWRGEDILKRFDSLPDDSLNVRAWKLATRVAKNFGVAAEAVGDALENGVSLEDALERVAEAFNDDAAQIRQSQNELAQLKTFVAAVPEREEIWRYTALAEATDEPEIENLRERILTLLERHDTAFDREAQSSLNQAASEFRERFAAYYVARHDSIVHSAQRQTQLEKLFQSGEWAEFVELSQFSIFHPRSREQSERLRQTAERLKCAFDVRALLRERPVCACGFRLITAENLKKLPENLRQTMDEGRAAYRQTLAQLAAPLAAALERVAQNAASAEIAVSAARLADYFARRETLPVLGQSDIKSLERALAEMPPLAFGVRAPRAATTSAVEREDLRQELNRWLDRLPASPFLVKLSDGGN